MLLEQQHYQSCTLFLWRWYIVILVYQFYGNTYTGSNLSMLYFGSYTVQENCMSYDFHYQFYFCILCLHHFVHEWHLTQTNQNYHKKTTAVVESLPTIQLDVLFQRIPAYFKRITTILDIVSVCIIIQLFMTWFAYELFLSNLSISFW